MDSAVCMLSWSTSPLLRWRAGLEAAAEIKWRCLVVEELRTGAGLLCEENGTLQVPTWTFCDWCNMMTCQKRKSQNSMCRSWLLPNVHSLQCAVPVTGMEMSPLNDLPIYLP